MTDTTNSNAGNSFIQSTTNTASIKDAPQQMQPVKTEDAFKNTPRISQYEVPDPTPPPPPPPPPTNEQTTESTSTTKDPVKESLDRVSQLAKAERRLQKQKSEAEAVIKRAEQMKGAFDTEDIFEALTKLGLSPQEIYRKMTDKALAKPEEPKDPMQIKIDEQEKKLQSYAEKQAAMEKQLQDERDNAAHINAINTHVAPVINNNPENYEILIDIYGSKENAISEVYKEMYTEFQKSGTTFTAKQAADAMEAYWEKELSDRIQKASSIKKFSKYFHKEETNIAKPNNNNEYDTKAESFRKILESRSETSAQATENTYKPAKTLTNQMNVSSKASNSTGKILSPIHGKEEREAYIDQFLANRLKH